MIDQFLTTLWIALIVSAATVSEVLLDFIFLYPLFMAFLWITGGVYFYFHWERRWKGPEHPPQFGDDAPLVSILIPCFNEERQVEETLLTALGQNYPNFEVIAVNDGSKDRTAEILDRMVGQHPRLRVVHLATNQGKAMALRAGAMASGGEYLVCIDGDAMLHPNATAFMVAPMINLPRVGAVTGNPRIRNRSSLLGSIQVGEFASIVGLIKRSQRVYGRIYTVSGVIAAFRRRALARIGWWSPDMVTEDIDVSWSLQRDHWSIFYEPNALCWILMPETLKGLWAQRLRWAQGGAEVFLKHVRTVWSWKQRRQWPMMFEYAVSTAWAFCVALSATLWVMGLIIDMPDMLRVATLFPPGFTGTVLAVACILQFLVSVLIESRYERGMERKLFWIVWYPLVYWLINLATTLVGFPKAILKRRGARARWVSPDRGIHTLEKTDA